MKRMIIAGLAAWAVLGWAGASTAGAEQTNFPVGQIAGSELKIGLGARPAGMGEAFAAQADDVNSTAWNPAGLAGVAGAQVSFMHTLYLQDTSLEYLSYAQPLSSGSGVGVYGMLMNYGNMDKLDETAAQIGQFSSAVYVLGAGYAQALWPGWNAGIAAKFISLSIDSQAFTAAAADLGCQFLPGPEGLKLGLALQNIGTKLGGASLPLNLKAGAGYRLPVRLTPQDSWCVLMDANLPFGDAAYTSVNLGTEYWYRQLLAVRLGYKAKNSGDLGGVVGLTAGAGLKAAPFALDYALVTFGDLGITHQISLTLDFGGEKIPAGK